MNESRNAVINELKYRRESNDIFYTLLFSAIALLLIPVTFFTSFGSLGTLLLIGMMSILGLLNNAVSEYSRKWLFVSLNLLPIVIAGILVWMGCEYHHN